MTILSDRWIRRMSQEKGMIEPFVEAQKRDGVISYGLSSYGYDARVGRNFKISPTSIRRVVDPRTSRPSFVDRTADVCIIRQIPLRWPARWNIPHHARRVVICVGKSTYAAAASS